MLPTFVILVFSLVSMPLQAGVPASEPSLTSRSAVTSSMPESTSAIVVENAWVRLMPPVSRMSAAYLTIKNNSSRVQTLLDCSSPDAGSVMIHQTQNTGKGRVGMRHLDKIEIPPGGLVTLAPGGTHIMLMGLKVATSEGQLITLQLDFTEGASVTISAPVRAQ